MNLKNTFYNPVRKIMKEKINALADMLFVPAPYMSEN